MKLVSVIMPCYNAEPYLDASLGSIYEQDYPEMEILVVNDGSVDGSEKKILAWKTRFEERGVVFKYLYQENQGPGAATNIALKHVTGDYLTLLDADDRYLPGAIRHKACFLDSHPDYAGVRNNGYLVQGSNSRLFITEEREKNISDLFTALSAGLTNNWAGTYMVRTDILFGFYPDRNILPSRLGQNFQILLPVAYGRKFGYVDLPLMEYHIYHNSHSHASTTEAQYHLSEKNAQGWRDIYFSILEKLVSDSKEYQQYARMYNEVYYRGCFCRAAHAAQDAAIISNYAELKKLNKVNLEDRVIFHAATKSPWLLFWKAMLKSSRIIQRIR